MTAQARIINRYHQLMLAGFLLLQAVQLVLIPLVLLHSDSTWGWLLMLPLLLSNSWWAFMHEAIHEHLFSNKFFGRIAGRINGVLYGVPFDLLRCGHMLHHAYSRTRRERTEVYTEGEGSRIAATIEHYFRLLGGLYVLEVIGGLAFLLPRFLIQKLQARIGSEDNVVDGLARRLASPAMLPSVRTDGLAILIVYGTSFYWYGANWWMLALALWGRGLLVSLMDNAFHYGTPLDSPRYARNLDAPMCWRQLLLNFNLHGLHHQYPAVPWHELPRLQQQHGSRVEGKLLPSILSQFRGPIPEHKLPVASPSGH